MSTSHQEPAAEAASKRLSWEDWGRGYGARRMTVQDHIDAVAELRAAGKDFVFFYGEKTAKDVAITSADTWASGPHS